MGLHHRAYEESLSGGYDPLKPRIMKGLTEALARADLHEVHQIQQHEISGANQSLFPYTPDLVMGYHGKKLGLSLLNDNNVMRDTGKADGRTAQ